MNETAKNLNLADSKLKEAIKALKQTRHDWLFDVEQRKEVNTLITMLTNAQDHVATLAHEVRDENVS